MIGFVTVVIGNLVWKISSDAATLHAGKTWTCSAQVATSIIVDYSYRCFSIHRFVWFSLKNVLVVPNCIKKCISRRSLHSGILYMYSDQRFSCTCLVKCVFVNYFMLLLVKLVDVISSQHNYYYLYTEHANEFIIRTKIFLEYRRKYFTFH